jgi:hypothetical protein
MYELVVLLFEPFLRTDVSEEHIGSMFKTFKTEYLMRQFCRHANGNNCGRRDYDVINPKDFLSVRQLGSSSEEKHKMEV